MENLMLWHLDTSPVYSDTCILKPGNTTLSELFGASNDSVPFLNDKFNIEISDGTSRESYAWFIIKDDPIEITETSFRIRNKVFNIIGLSINVYWKQSAICVPKKSEKMTISLDLLKSLPANQ